MTALLPRFVDALRNELQQLGEMLALLDAQQDITIRRAPDFIEPSFATVMAHGAQVETARARRRLLQEQIAQLLNRRTAILQELVADLPSEYRPLVAALMRENADLISRVRERAEQNHRLLCRCADDMRRFTTVLSPENDLTLPTSETQLHPNRSGAVLDSAAAA
jgi:hypothetical protein